MNPESKDNTYEDDNNKSEDEYAPTYTYPITYGELVIGFAMFWVGVAFALVFLQK